MEKLFRKTITNWFDDWRFYRPVFCTGVLSNDIGYGDGEFHYDLIRKTNKHFLNELHRQVYKKSKKKLTRLIVIERGVGRNHCHMVLDTPENLSLFQFSDLIKQSWMKTRNGVSVDLLPVYDLEGLNNYLSKEIFPNSEMLGVDIQNCRKTL